MAQRDEVEARYESSAYGIVEGAAAVAAPVAESYARGVPLMLEGELGAGQVEIAKRLYLDGPFADQPFVSVALDELTERGWRHVLKSAESPLFQMGLTLCIEGWNAVGPQRLRELVSTMTDTALATRCHVVLTANDMPGGGESDQAAFVTERFACAVSVAPAIAEQGAASTKAARYLEYLADAFGTAAPRCLSRRRRRSMLTAGRAIICSSARSRNDCIYWWGRARWTALWRRKCSPKRT